MIRGYFGSGRLGLEAEAGRIPGDAAPTARPKRVIRAQSRRMRRGIASTSSARRRDSAAPGTRWRWVVDPIDGTRSFVRGIPLFGSMIGLEDTEDGRALLGVIHLPMLGVTYAGGRGLGATRNGKTIRLPDSVALEDAIIASATSRRSRRPDAQATSAG